MTSDSAILAQVREALDDVLDPCSVGVGNPTSIVELGLVEDITCTDGQVRVVLCVTAPVCLMVAPMFEAIRDATSAIDGVGSVEVNLDPTVVWTTARVHPEHAERLARWNEARRAAAAVEPQAWRAVL